MSGPITEARTYFHALGPWAAAETAAAYLHVSPQDLRRKIARLEVLAVVFNDNQPYLPVWQFDDGGVVDGFAQIVAVLHPAYIAPGTIAGWFVSSVFEGQSLRRIDALRTGDIDGAIADARRDIRRILE